MADYGDEAHRLAEVGLAAQRLGQRYDIVSAADPHASAQVPSSTVVEHTVCKGARVEGPPPRGVAEVPISLCLACNDVDDTFPYFHGQTDVTLELRARISHVNCFLALSVIGAVQLFGRGEGCVFGGKVSREGRMRTAAQR